MPDAGIYGGSSGSLSISEGIKLIPVKTQLGEVHYASIRTREVAETIDLVGEIGIKCAGFTAVIDRLNWSEREDVEIVGQPARIGDNLTADVTKPLVKAGVVAVLRKRVGGSLTVKHNVITDGSDVPSDFRLSETNPFTSTSSSYAFSSEASSPVASLTMPVGTRLSLKSQGNSMDGFTTSTVGFEFITANTIDNIETHLVLMASQSDSPDIADFGGNSMSDNDGTKYAISKDFNLTGNGESEARLSQTILVYSQDDYY